jgi:hypothetical protein
MTMLQRLDFAACEMEHLHFYVFSIRMDGVLQFATGQATWRTG